MTEPHNAPRRVSPAHLSNRLIAWAARGLVALASTNTRLRNRVMRTLLDRHLAPGVLCLVPFGDHALYVDPRDDKVALKLLSGRPWQRRELKAALSALKAAGSLRPDSVFIDVGANIGTQTIYALRSGHFTRAIAIEVDPHNFAILARNVAVNALADTVHLQQAAASDREGTLRLSHHDKNYGAHSVEPAFLAKSTGAIDVAAITIDGLLDRLSIAPDAVGLVKIDVEGHELAVLAGMDRLRAVRVPVLVEFTADPADVARVGAFKALFASGYTHVQDLSSGAAPVRLADFAWQTHQADLLIT